MDPPLLTSCSLLCDSAEILARDCASAANDITQTINISYYGSVG